MVLVVACADVAPTPTSTSVTRIPTKTMAIVPTALPTAPSVITPLHLRILSSHSAEATIFTNVAHQIESAHPQFDLTFEVDTDDYYSTLWAELNAGTAPDLFWLPATKLSDFVRSGHLLDLRDYANTTSEYDDDLFYSGPMFHLTFASTSQKDKRPLWGLPRSVSTLALYLNLDLLAEADAPDPRALAVDGQWNWEALRSVSQQVTDARMGAAGYGQKSWWGTHGAWIFGAGGSYLNTARSGCLLDSAESLAGLDFERTLYDDLRVAVPLGDAAVGEFLNGNVGLYLDGRWFTSTMREEADFDWDVVALPEGQAGAFNWLFWGAYVVNAETKHPEEAWDLVWALSSAEIQQYITAAGINLPSRVGTEYIQTFLDSIPPTNNVAFLAGLENAVVEAPLWNAEFAAVDSASQHYIEQFLRGEISRKRFVEGVCTAVGATLP